MAAGANMGIIFGIQAGTVAENGNGCNSVLNNLFKYHVKSHQICVT